MSPNNQPFAPAGDASGATMDQASLQNMALKISRLEEENRKLKGSPPRSAEERYQVLYKIHGEDSAYLSEPSWSLRGTGLPDLRGHSPIPDTEGYLNRQPEIVFVIEKHYTVEHQKKEIEKAISDRAALPDPKPAYEIIKLMPGAMVEAAEAFRKAQPSFNQDFPNWQPATLPSPFLFWYRYRESGIVDMLSGSDRSLMKLLTGWIEDNYGGIYAKVKEQFSRGVVSSSTMPFFVLPQDVLVSRQGNTTQCYTASSWAQKTVAANSFSKVLSAEDKEEVVEIWQVKVWSYGYDGGFYRNDSEVTLRLKLDEKNPEIDITTLEVFPLRFASAELQSLVDRQGRVVWKCRYKSLVSYEENREDQLYGHGERFMIDFDTYKQLHSDSTKFKRAYPQLNKRDRKEMDPKLMHSDEPPAAPHRLVLPSTMIGYNLRQKKWMDLQVDRIRDVSWNTDAFNHLVVDEDTKELIRALVSSKLDAEQGTDVIEGKGNGLIILLHGGPGTGKTFTAESVAEIAKKPLYRVTCGDIGTKPEEVEKYLESVLYLGKIWDCVVLLDEADVFLEQRTLMDLERNALVSVFLRVLEYYEGILILTSNRVGTFDDAFKSRIQLSLHYEPLTLEQRITIWRNFMKRLKKLEADASLQRARKAGSDAGGGSRYEPPAELAQAGRIDFDDIQYNIKELAAINMNGRQIRNTITTARQLAKFNGVPMKFTHLRHVIKVSSKFEDYLNELHGSTDEQLAREDRTR